MTPAFPLRHANHPGLSIRAGGRVLLLIVAATASLWGSAAEAGEVSVRTQAVVSPYNSFIKANSGTVTSTFNRPYNSWAFRNYAAASFGGLVISARETLNAFEGGVHQAASISAHWEDRITIDAPGLTGQGGVMTLTYRVNGYLVFTGTASQTPDYNRAELFAGLYINSATADSATYQLSYTGVSNGADFLNADRQIQWGFTFGTPFTVKLSLGSYTAISGNNGPGHRSEVEAAGLWKGITVTHQGSPVANFTSSSSTVPIWSQLLPPPLPKLVNGIQGNEIVLTWPKQAACVLTTSPNLSAWAPSTAEVVMDDMFKTVRIPMIPSTAFFRLESSP